LGGIELDAAIRHSGIAAVKQRWPIGAAFAVAVVVASWSPHAAVGGVQPTPSPAASQTPPPDVASTPTPIPVVINGEVIDLERGYIVFSTGDAFRLAPNAPIVDDATGGAPAFALDPGFFAVAYLDGTSGIVESVRVSKHPLAAGQPAVQVPRRLVSVATPWRPNPDLIPRRGVYRDQLSKSTAVTLVVEVPADTPFTDDVFMTTDTSGWNPQAIRMQRVDGLHFRIQVDLAGGTDFHYLFTRGSWKSVERDKSGLERAPREFFVPGGTADVIEARVYRWADIQ
jgi:hypothetical protein